MKLDVSTGLASSITWDFFIPDVSFRMIKHLSMLSTPYLKAHALHSPSQIGAFFTPFKTQRTSLHWLKSNTFHSSSKNQTKQEFIGQKGYSSSPNSFPVYIECIPFFYGTILYIFVCLFKKKKKRVLQIILALSIAVIFYFHFFSLLQDLLVIYQNRMLNDYLNVRQFQPRPRPKEAYWT